MAKDVTGNFNFLVEIDGLQQSTFAEVSGLGSRIQVLTYREGGGALTVRNLPGLVTYDPIVLRWGLATDDELFQWHRAVAEGSLDRRNGRIVVLDRQGQPVASWNFRNAWPSRYRGPHLVGSGDSKVAIETLELVHEGLQRESSGG